MAVIVVEGPEMIFDLFLTRGGEGAKSALLRFDLWVILRDVSFHLAVIERGETASATLIRLL